VHLDTHSSTSPTSKASTRPRSAPALDRLNTMAGAQAYPVVCAQLRTSGIRVHMT
jgi:hypothetical protein